MFTQRGLVTSFLIARPFACRRNWVCVSNTSFAPVIQYLFGNDNFNQRGAPESLKQVSHSSFYYAFLNNHPIWKSHPTMPTAP